MKIISHILHSLLSQILLYVEEKKEVNKNQIIKKISYEMNLLFKNNELIIIRFIKTIVDNVRNFTIYSALEIEIKKRIFNKTRD
jgi:hypothetical protein